jgi:hypothetical protein
MTGSSNKLKAWIPWHISPEEIKALNLFWIAFIFYTVCYLLKGSINISMKIFELGQLAAVALLIAKGVSLSKPEIKNSYLRFMFIIYIIWLLYVISRGIQFNYDSMKNLLINADYGILLYLAPLVLLFPKNLSYYKKLSDAILLSGIFYLICSVLFYRQLTARTVETKGSIEYLVNYLGITCGFILLTYKYHSTKRNLLALTVMMLSVLLSIYKARRGLTAICLSTLIASYFLYLYSTKRKILVIYLSALATVVILLYATNKYKLKKGGLFDLIAERGNVDTRTDVELYFYNDMTSKDWLLGRGINGEYYCPDIYQTQETDYRSYIETGYLQIVLKGGIVELILFLMITVPAVILGILFSKNILSKAAGIWILILLFALYPGTINTFSFRFLLLWISVGICYSKKIRNLSDNDIQLIFETPYKSLQYRA